MKKIPVLIFALLLSTAAIYAQKVTGSVKDEQLQPLEKATVTLHRAKDSAVVKLFLTDNTGAFTAIADTAGAYLISISQVGYSTKFSAVFELTGADVNLGDFQLSKAEASLGNVTVTAKKPMVEVRADKTIVNVEGTINSTGNDGLELLRKSPGVMIDKDDNISMAGKNGVQLYIDGKPSPLTGADRANFLRSLQAAQIESIELITNPSAKYEAAGNAGIINIRLKKNKTFGTNGSVNAGYNVGIYGKYNGGVALNHRNKKINLFGTYNYSRSLTATNFDLYREQADSVFAQTNRMKINNKGGHNFKTGIDYFINSKSTIGAIVNGDISNTDFNSSGPMKIIYKPTGEVNRILLASSNNDMSRENVNFNINYRYASPKGQELNLDADYGFFNLRSNQFQPNYYVAPDGKTPIYNTIYRMISPTNIDIYSFKADYEQPFKKGKLGFGGKIGYVNTDNDFNRYDVHPTAETMDIDRSNRFQYKENINAGYVNYNRPFKGFMIQAGLRVENTHSDGKSTGQRFNGTSYQPYDSTVNRDYTDLFPSAALTFNKNPMSQVSLTYSRRIDRPAYQDLNPFEFKLNDYTFMKGNTQLRPQYTNSFGITHSYKYKLNTTLNYSHVKDIFTQLPDTTEKSKSFLTKRNLATQDIVSLNISYPFQYKFWSLFLLTNTNYSKYKADFGGGDRKVNLDVIAFMVVMQNSFKLNKTLTAELGGFYNSPTIWQGTFKSKSMYQLEAGMQKVIMKGNGTLKVAVSDIFKTLKFSGSTNFSGAYSRASGNFESRQLKLSFAYRFGSNQIKAARQRKTGLDDENKRANGSGGQPGQQ